MTSSEDSIHKDIIAARLNNLEVRMDAVKTEVLGVKSDIVGVKDSIRVEIGMLGQGIQKSMESLNTNLTTIASAAIGKSNGFDGKDVLFLLAGVGLFTFGLIYGLDKLGVLQKFIQ